MNTPFWIYCRKSCVEAGDGGWSPRDPTFMYSGSRHHKRKLYLPMQIVQQSFTPDLALIGTKRRRVPGLASVTCFSPQSGDVSGQVGLAGVSSAFGLARVVYGSTVCKKLP